MKNTPFATLTELARHRTDEASRRLGELQRAQLGAGEQLRLLLNLRSDYLAQLAQKMALGLTMDQLRNFQQFIAMLDEAIALQAGHTEQAAQRLSDGRQAWQHSARRLGAFDTLAGRLQRQALEARSRGEQRDTDERAARARNPQARLDGALQTDGEIA